MSQEVLSSTKKKEATREDIAQDLVEICDYLGVHFLFACVTQQQFCNTMAPALVVIIIIVVVVVRCVKLITSFGLILFAYEWSTIKYSFLFVFIFCLWYTTNRLRRPDIN